MLGADLIESGVARDWGVLDEVVPASDVLHRATQVARALAKLPSQTYGEVKHQLRGATLEAIRAGMERLGSDAEWLSDETTGAAAQILSKSRPH